MFQQRLHQGHHKGTPLCRAADTPEPALSPLHSASNHHSKQVAACNRAACCYNAAGSQLKTQFKKPCQLGTPAKSWKRRPRACPQQQKTELPQAKLPPKQPAGLSPPAGTSHRLKGNMLCSWHQAELWPAHNTFRTVITHSLPPVQAARWGLRRACGCTVPAGMPHTWHKTCTHTPPPSWSAFGHPAS